MYTTSVPYLIHQKHELKFNNFRYYLPECNRFLFIFKNISHLKRFFPLFTLLELS